MSSKIRTRRRLMGAGLGTLMSSALLNIGCWGKPKKENNPWMKYNGADQLPAMEILKHKY